MNAFKMKLLLILLGCLCFTTGSAETRSCAWEHAANAAISGFNDVHLTSVTVDQCKEACCANTRCKSFDYHKRNNACDLSFSSASAVGGLTTDYVGNPYDHYALLPCYGSLGGLSSSEGTMLSSFSGSFTVAQAVERCEAESACNSFGLCGNGVWLFDKSYEGNEPVDESRQSCETYYRLKDCQTCATPLSFYTSLFLAQQQRNGVVGGCCNNALNFGAGGDFIHLHAGKSTMFPTNDFPAISDVFLTNKDCGRDAIKVGGCCDEGDLNNNSGGKFLYLCYTPGSGEGDYVSDLKLVEGKNQFCGLGYERVVHKTHVDGDHANNGDLNEGVSGAPFVYLCMKKEKCNPPVQAALGIKTIGYWLPRPEVRLDFEEVKEIVMEFSGSRAEEDSQNELKSFSQDLREKHSAEVAFEVGGTNGIVEAKLSAKYAYENERSRNEKFETELSKLASRTYSQKTIIKRKITVPARKKHESVFQNVWVWKTEAIREDLSHAGHFLDFALPTTGCGYDVPPNCLPGFCLDDHCWDCTRKDMEINPDFVKPECQIGEDCEWVAIPTEDCPSRLEIEELDACTLDMKHGELCEADSPLPDRINDEDAHDNFEVNNCPNNKDVFRYICSTLKDRNGCDFRKTFAATGCPNEKISQGTLDFWERQKFDAVLVDMLRYCHVVKDGVATEAQKQECCGDSIDCQAGLKCVEQTTFTLCH